MMLVVGVKISDCHLGIQICVNVLPKYILYTYVNRHIKSPDFFFFFFFFCNVLIMDSYTNCVLKINRMLLFCNTYKVNEIYFDRSDIFNSLCQILPRYYVVHRVLSNNFPVLLCIAYESYYLRENYSMHCLHGLKQ